MAAAIRSTPPVSALRRYERREHGPAFISWTYEYWNPSPIIKEGLGAGIELGVQLAGEWQHEGARHPRRVYGPGSIHRLDPGERYRVSFSSRAQTSVQVGFIVYPDELGITGADEELRVPDRAGGEDHALLSFCREYYAAYESGVLSDADIHSALLGYLARHGEVAAMDPILVGKRELERYFDRELRIEHIAEAAGLHPVRFARRFKARFGMSPVSYRLAWRLNHAARLSWAQPTRSIEEIAADCGFNSLPFFHRRFIEQFGMTPAAYGGRR